MVTNFNISETFKAVSNTLRNFTIMGATVFQIAGGGRGEGPVRTSPFGKRCGY